MEKYITISVPGWDDNGDNLSWWVPEHMPRVIAKVEKNNPDYEFHQIVTSPGNGNYREFIIMKLKSNKDLRKDKLNKINYENR